LLELLEYLALAVGAVGGEFDVGQGRVDGGHGVTFWSCGGVGRDCGFGG
jgi:hypothetical protein